MAVKTLVLLLGLLAQDTPEELRTEIESLKPGKLAWKEIPWINCPLEALRKSRAEKKPIVVCVFLGNPSDERC